MIAKCDKCGNRNDSPATEYQNERYGKGMRVHNERPSGAGKVVSVRCVVCSNEKTVAT